MDGRIDIYGKLVGKCHTCKHIAHFPDTQIFSRICSITRKANTGYHVTDTMACLPERSIIYSLKLVDYLSVQADSGGPSCTRLTSQSYQYHILKKIAWLFEQPLPNISEELSLCGKSQIIFVKGSFTTKYFSNNNQHALKAWTSR